MKPTIGIIGFPKTITIARKVARGYRGRSRFTFITSVLDDSIDVISRHEKNGLDIHIAGPGNSHIFKKACSDSHYHLFREYPNVDPCHIKRQKNYQWKIVS